MGLMMSVAGKGLPAKVIGKVTDRFHEEFVKKNIEDFDKFHLEILEMFATVNAALPGKHWNVPSREKIEACYKDYCKQKSEEEKEELVRKFMTDNIEPSKMDKTSLIIGLAAPPAAMATKKAGEGVPQLKFIKAIPDVLFVPAVTVLALSSIKLSRYIFTSPEDRLVKSKETPSK